MIDALRRHGREEAWVRVDVGRSGAAVYRLDGPETVFAKVVPRRHARRAAELGREAERAAWLGRQGFPAPAVEDHDGDGEYVWLVTRGLPGRAASDPWPARQRRAVIDAVADLARDLHALDPTTCPFDRTLAVAVPDAVGAAEDGDVDLADLDEERRGWNVSQLVAELRARVPAVQDLVVCHGDYCLPNVLVDPETLRPTGVVDLGRLGVADRYADLALVTRSICGDLNPQFGPDLAERFLTRYLGEQAVDRERIAFYRLLDEFF